MPITREIETRTSPSYDLFERSVLRLKVEEVRRGRDVLAGPSVFLVMRREYHQTVGLRIGQRFDNPSVDTTEDGSVCTNPEGQRQDRDDRERAALCQHSQAVAQIQNQVLNPVNSAHVTAFLLYLFHATEVEPRMPVRLSLRHPLRHVFLGFSFEVVAQLVVQFVGRLRPAKQ